MSKNMVPFDHPWKEDMIGNIGSVIVGGTPRTSVAKYWNGNIPWMSSGDVHLRKITDVPGRITELGLKYSNATMVEPPTVAIALAGQGKTRGTAALVLCELCTNQSVALIKCNPEVLNTPYLYFNLEFRYEELRSRSTGGGRAGLSKQLIEQIPVPLPFPSEQAKIAEILSAVDQAIEQTELLIGKQRRIKIGLIQDLLSRGIDGHGRLRSEQTHKFKTSALGMIPTEWNLKRLADVLADEPRNGIYVPPGQIGSGTLLIGQTSFTEERRLDYSLARRAKISEDKLRVYGLCENDLLITRVFATVEGVGRPVLVTDLTEEAVYESNMLRLRIDKDQMLPEFAFYWLSSSLIRKQIESAVNASNQASVNQKVLRDLPFVTLPLGEQREIVKIVSKQEGQLREYQSLQRKLNSIKMALMQDLLTGAKRLPLP